MQLKEHQARLDEQRRQTQELRTALEQQHTAHGMQARAAGRVAWERILADNVDIPPETEDGQREIRRCGLPTPSEA